MPGPDGFQLAWFGEEGPISTEIPNLLLELGHVEKGKKERKKKKSADEKLLKRPAAKGASENLLSQEKLEGQEDEDKPFGEDGDADADGEAPPAPNFLSYHTMFYRQKGVYAVRQRYGQRKQIFQIGQSSGFSLKQRKAIVEKMVAKLEKGESEKTVISWARAYRAA